MLHLRVHGPRGWPPSHARRLLSSPSCLAGQQTSCCVFSPHEQPRSSDCSCHACCRGQPEAEEAHDIILGLEDDQEALKDDPTLARTTREKFEVVRRFIASRGSWESGPCIRRRSLRTLRKVYGFGSGEEEEPASHEPTQQLHAAASACAPQLTQSAFV